MLTDELVIDGVLGVILRNVVFAVDDLELGSFFKRMLFKTEQIQDTAQSLKNRQYQSFNHGTLQK